MSQIETTIRLNLCVWNEIYKTERKINPDVAETYLAKAHGYRKGLELAFNQKFLSPIFEDYPDLWTDYDE